ncbi:MAG: cobalamin biosynthesis protein, partial [Candidatus Omnitrophica bacterium]|nr:cobalamin biosynthesis protein [Candidatus Omnitrophota bacterium]
YAVSVLSGHEGGANQLAYSAAAAIDAEPVITTGTEVHKRFIIGIGCRKGVSKLKIKKAIDFVLKANKIKRTQVRLVATAALKKDEQGLIQACLDLQLPLVFISTEQIKRFKADISVSEIVKRHIGVEGVCEPCALIAGRRTKLLWPKQIIDSVTAALAMEN